MTEGKDRANILLLQNKESTLHVVQRALEANNTRCRLQMVGIGRGTLSYLRQDGPYAKAPTPNLVLCDLVEPTPEVISVIKAIKSDRHCRLIPTVYLISDKSNEAVELLSVNCNEDSSFSPVDLDSFLKALNSFKMEKFMHAVSLLERFGSILVKMPDATGDEDYLGSRSSLKEGM